MSRLITMAKITLVILIALVKKGTAIVFFSHPTADFNQKYLDGIQAREVSGERLGNGNFIFHWRNDSLWKMVLTNNTGKPIYDGHILEPGVTWKDPKSWSILKPLYYFISNFKGSNKGPFSICAGLDTLPCSTGPQEPNWCNGECDTSKEECKADKCSGFLGMVIADSAKSDKGILVGSFHGSPFKFLSGSIRFPKGSSTMRTVRTIFYCLKILTLLTAYL